MATASPEGPQIFICYDKTYQERALELHARLANDLQGKLSRDVIVFIDRENLASGDAWDARLREALAAARLMIVLLNDGLVTRPYCRFEIETFLSRMKSGERCHILPVRWQRDSEIYRAGAIGSSSAEALDRAYLGSLPAESAALVATLREIQFLDGAALREDIVGSESFNAAFRQLSAEATRLYRLAQRDQQAPPPIPLAAAPPGTASTAAVPARSRFLAVGIAAVIAVAGLAWWFVSKEPAVDRPVTAEPGPVETAPGLVETVPEWIAMEQALENRSGGDVVARREPRPDAPELETLGPGAMRPALGVAGPVLEADIDGVRWLSYPTPVQDVRGFVRQTDIDTPVPRAGSPGGASDIDPDR